MATKSVALLADRARPFLSEHNLDGWLVYDFQRSNPIFWELVGGERFVTRPIFLFIPAIGEPSLLVQAVDAGKVADLGIASRVYSRYEEKLEGLRITLAGAKRVAMEYSPLASLPAISRVDAGTVELVQSLGAAVVSSAEIMQHALGCLSEEQVRSHLSAAAKLGEIVSEAFAFIGRGGQTDYDVFQFIRERYKQEGLTTGEGPAVQVNARSSDPHYEPTAANTTRIEAGDWVLLDLWAREPEGTYADITWVGCLGTPSAQQREVFDVVAGARDLAVEFLRSACRGGLLPQGWQVDRAARDYVAASGYGEYFSHRLGHSLGAAVHSFSANLDDFETHDVRPLVPGLAFTIEPGIYLPEFGVRSEIDVFMADQGPRVTTPVQRSIVNIGRQEQQFLARG